MKKNNKIIAIQGDSLQTINRKTDTTRESKKET